LLFFDDDSFIYFIYKKYQKYIFQFGEFFKEIVDEFSVNYGSIVVIQELGAFAPVIALYDISRNLKLNHFFLGFPENLLFLD